MGKHGDKDGGRVCEKLPEKEKIDGKEGVRAVMENWSPVCRRLGLLTDWR